MKWSLVMILMLPAAGCVSVASDAIGQAANGIEVVLNPNDGAALRAPVLEQLFKNFYAFGIQRSHRLVEQQQVWRW